MRFMIVAGPASQQFPPLKIAALEDGLTKYPQATGAQNPVMGKRVAGYSE